MSQNTVCEHACDLGERQFIRAESTTVVTKDKLKHNSDLLYTIRLIRLELNQFYK